MPHEGNLLQAAVVFLFAAVLTVPWPSACSWGPCLAICWPG